MYICGHGQARLLKIAYGAGISWASWPLGLWGALVPLGGAWVASAVAAVRQVASVPLVPIRLPVFPEQALGQVLGYTHFFNSGCLERLTSSSVIHFCWARFV